MSNATNMISSSRLNSELNSFQHRLLFKMLVAGHRTFGNNIERRLGPFKANFEYPGVFPIRLSEASLLEIPVQNRLMVCFRFHFYAYRRDVVNY